MTLYKIGTRGSLLAVTQSTLLFTELAQLTNNSFELIKIKTQGDQVTDKPLWQLEGKDFFTKELDEALLKHEVDFVIHSYKDLGSERPNHIKLGAITQRKYPHDILLIKKETIKALQTNSMKLKIGTSSPRRITNITKYLSDFLPGTNHEISCETLRGNVNTRVQKLNDNQYDAIILALAGLERLASFPESRIELEKLLSGLTFMILPTMEFPPAASQGALGVEYAETNPKAAEIKKLLSFIHHPATADAVAFERKIFHGYGGGCHLAVGVHVKKIHNQYLEIHRGEVDQKKIDELKISPREISLTKPQFIFLGHGKKTGPKILRDHFFQKEMINFDLPKSSSHLIVTSNHASESLLSKHSSEEIQKHSLWVSGTKTWKSLKDKNFWVLGSHEGLGDEILTSFFESKAIEILTKNQSIHFLSHENATAVTGENIGVYKHIEKTIPVHFLDQLKNVTHCYWSSMPQFKFYTSQCPNLINQKHYCGPGKTFQRLKDAGIKAEIVLNSDDFLQLIQYKD